LTLKAAAASVRVSFKNALPAATSHKRSVIIASPAPQLPFVWLQAIFLLRLLQQSRRAAANRFSGTPARRPRSSEMQLAPCADATYGREWKKFADLGGVGEKFSDSFSVKRNSPPPALLPRQF